ncbi:MAG: hypothetical protein JWN79_711 [Gemmatimonadetes bacterium]|jgi:hypothetical protein|nr:hypothetical protein [Gemmatimonadota bacterium]
MSKDKLHDREITGPAAARRADLPVVRVMALPGTAGGATLAGAPVRHDEAVDRPPAARDDAAPAHERTRALSQHPLDAANQRREAEGLP